MPGEQLLVWCTCSSDCESINAFCTNEISMHSVLLAQNFHVQHLHFMPDHDKSRSADATQIEALLL
jgi:hypothetical protein